MQVLSFWVPPNNKENFIEVFERKKAKDKDLEEKKSDNPVYERFKNIAESIWKAIERGIKY